MRTCVRAAARAVLYGSFHDIAESREFRLVINDEFDDAVDAEEFDELEFDNAAEESGSASGVGPCAVSAINLLGSLSATVFHGCATESREHLL